MSNAITPYSKLKSLVEVPTVKSQFVDMLGAQKGAALMTSMLNAVSPPTETAWIM